MKKLTESIRYDKLYEARKTSKASKNMDKKIQKLRDYFLKKYKVSKLEDLKGDARDIYLEKMDQIISTGVFDLEDDMDEYQFEESKQINEDETIWKNWVETEGNSKQIMAFNTVLSWIKKIKYLYFTDFSAQFNSRTKSIIIDLSKENNGEIIIDEKGDIYVYDILTKNQINFERNLIEGKNEKIKYNRK